MIPPILEAFQAHFKAGDCVKFISKGSDGLGEIISEKEKTVRLRVLKLMESNTLQQHFLRPYMNEDENFEVYQSPK